MRVDFRRTGIRTALALALASGPLASAGEAGQVLLQSTTSTANSGFYDYLLPLIERHTGIRVHVVAVGTGQAIRNARNCDADLLLVHDRLAEEQFVAEGFGLRRYDLMTNDFVLVGPATDPAGVEGIRDASLALRAIGTAGALFVSRGDDSGTHRTELALWRKAGIDPRPHSGTWYRETGSGMGSTINVGINLDAYILTDRATWLAFPKKGAFRILLEGDRRLGNAYGLIPVHPARCPHARAEAALLVVNWLRSRGGQDAIRRFRIGDEQVFFPNAGPD